MWNRIRRLFRAMFGWMLGGAENPEMILRQLREDLRNKVPELNRQVAEIVKQEKMLEMQLQRQADLIAKLRPQVEAAVKAGPTRKDAAKALIMQLQQAEAEMADTQGALAKAQENSQQMLRMRSAYEQKVRQQMQEAMRQISRVKRAQVESEMADLMSSFEVGDETQTLEAMTDRIDERLARAEARMQVASSGVDAQIAQVEQDASMEAVDVAYEEYQRQLGLIPETTDAVAKTMEAMPAEQIAPPAAAAAPPAAPPGTPPQETQRQTEDQQQS